MTKALSLCLVFVTACLGGAAQVARVSQAVLLSPTTPWPLHVIHGGPRGADGVDLRDINGDGHKEVATAWEQEGIVTVATLPAGPTAVIAQNIGGAEDAKIADVDGDGVFDVVVACECKKLVIFWGPSWTPTFLPASFQRWINVAAADLVGGDGVLEVIGGGKGSPATIGYFRTTGDPRDPASWVYVPMSPVAWTESIVPLDPDGDGDLDVVMSDKQYIKVGGVIDYSLLGTRWLEQISSTIWINHPIGYTPGDKMFIRVVDFDADGKLDILDGSWPNHLTLRRTVDWIHWTGLALPVPANVGYYQDVATGDIDLDGKADYALSYSAADGTLSSVVWMRSVGTSWERMEVSGPLGIKCDNLELDDVEPDGDLDIVTTEELEDTDGNGTPGPGLGLIFYENLTVP